MKKLIKISAVILLVNGVAVGSGIIDNERLEEMYGAAPVVISVKQAVSSELDEDVAIISKLEKDLLGGTYISSMRAEGEGSVVIGMNGVVAGRVDKSEAKDDGTFVVSNRGDVEIERENTAVLISGTTTSNNSGVSSPANSIHVGDMAASGGGLAIGTNQGSIKIVRKKKSV